MGIAHPHIKLYVVDFKTYVTELTVVVADTRAGSSLVKRQKTLSSWVGVEHRTAEHALIGSLDNGCDYTRLQHSR